MAGTRAGGIRAAATNKARHGEDFYARIGQRGGKNGHSGGFAYPIPCECDTIQGAHLIRQCAGLRGGIKSRRGKKIQPVEG